jgi:hypothetical protein
MNVVFVRRAVGDEVANASRDIELPDRGLAIDGTTVVGVDASRNEGSGAQPATKRGDDDGGGVGAGLDRAFSNLISYAFASGMKISMY